MDYKVAYRDSIHHIRNFEKYDDNKSNFYIGDPITETVPEKLERL
jgi:hypothetical protein